MSEEKQTSLFDGDGDGEAEEQELEDAQVNGLETEGESADESGQEEPGEAESAGDEECGCEEEAEPGKGKGKGRGKGKKDPTKAGAPATPAKPAATPAKPAEKTFPYPFLIRYAGSYMDEVALMGFEEGKGYTTAQIKERIIAAGYKEFREMEIEFFHDPETSTLVITMKGSRKGGSTDDR